MCTLVRENFKHKNSSKPNKKIRAASSTINYANKKITIPTLRDSKKYVTKIAKSLQANLTENQQEQLTTIFLKIALTNKSSKENNNKVSLKQLRGKPLKVDVLKSNRAHKSKHQFSAEKMHSLRAIHNFSLNETIKLTGHMRQLDSQVFEPKLTKNLQEMTHVFDNFFKETTLEFTKEKGTQQTKVEETVVYCHRLLEFIKFIKQHRNEQYVHLKIGADGGWGSLKICISIQSLIPDNEEDLTKKRKSKQMYKDSGVKMLFVLAIAHNIQENHDNVSKLFHLLDISSLDELTET